MFESPVVEQSNNSTASVVGLFRAFVGLFKFFFELFSLLVDHFDQFIDGTEPLLRGAVLKLLSQPKQNQLIFIDCRTVSAVLRSPVVWFYLRILTLFVFPFLCSYVVGKTHYLDRNFSNSIRFMHSKQCNLLYYVYTCELCMV